jgi:hypothetical protein
MNRMRVAGFSIGFLGLIICLAVGFFIQSYLFIISACTFKFDSYFAELSQQNIMRFGHDTFINKPFQKIPLESIKEKFPFVDSIAGMYSFGGKLVCTIKSLRPLLRINNNKLMMTNGQIFDDAYFSQEMAYCVPTMSVKNKTNVLSSQLFKDYLQSFPHDLFDIFSIIWLNHTVIELHDKKDTSFTMIAQCQTDFNSRLVHHYELIKKHIMSQRSYAKKQWNIDVRFKNQIIVGQRTVEDS